MKKNYEQAILDLLATRSPDKTACPSELLPPSEKKNATAMELVRASARSLVAAGKLEITQKGKVVDPAHLHGPIRLRLKR